MYYGLVYYPNLAHEGVERLRRRYDPTAAIIDLHLTVMFPVPDSVGEQPLIDHLTQVLASWEPFPVRLGGLQKSPDHWLFLTLAEGNQQMVALNREIYSGMLAKFHRDDLEFIPHLSLGLFLVEGVRYDWNNPRDADFDAESYQAARQEAEAWQIDLPLTVDELHLVKLVDEVIEWVSGGRDDFPNDARVEPLKIFTLGRRQ
jgi:2'-5' RNA ligase